MYRGPLFMPSVHVKKPTDIIWNGFAYTRKKGATTYSPALLRSRGEWPLVRVGTASLFGWETYPAFEVTSNTSGRFTPPFPTIWLKVEGGYLALHRDGYLGINPPDEAVFSPH